MLGVVAALALSCEPSGEPAVPERRDWPVYGSDQAFLMATPEPFRLIRDDNVTRAGSDVLRLNAELAQLGPVLVNLMSVDVFHAPVPSSVSIARSISSRQEKTSWASASSTVANIARPSDMPSPLRW